MRWTQLQQQIHNILAPELRLKIHCTKYPLSGSANIGRCWITLNRKIIWDVPRDFSIEREKGTYNDVASRVTKVLKEYLATSKDKLLSSEFSNDKWGLTDILLVADRRIGNKRLSALAKRNLSPVAKAVLEERNTKKQY